MPLWHALPALKMRALFRMELSANFADTKQRRVGLQRTNILPM